MREAVLHSDLQLYLRQINEVELLTSDLSASCMADIKEQLEQSPFTGATGEHSI